MIQILVIIAFILIIISLGFALFNLVSGKSEAQSEKTLKALTFRITLSIIVFIVVFIAIATGIFDPHGIGVQMQMKKPATVQSSNNH